MALLTVSTDIGPKLVTAGQIDMSVPSDLLIPGQGFHSSVGKQGMVNAVDYNFSADEMTSAVPGDFKGQASGLVLESFDNFDELTASLNISASASLGMGIYSGSASYKLEATERHTRFDNYLMVSVRSRNPAKVLKRPIMSASALKILNGSQEDFLKYCGNSYVYGYVTGGELIGIHRYTASSDEQSSRVRLEVQAAAQGYGNGSLTVDQAFKKVTQQSSTHFTLIRNGGLGDLPDMDHLIEAAKRFAEDVKDPANAYLLSLFVRGYQTVLNPPVQGLDLGLIGKQASSLDRLSAALATTYERRNEWLLVKDHQGEYELGQDPDNLIATALDKLQATVTSLGDLATSILAAPGSHGFDGSYELPILPNPKAPVPLPVLEVYDAQNFQGRRLVVNSDIPNLQATDVGDINDQIRSLRVNGKPGEYRVSFYVKGNYQDGVCTVISPYEMPAYTPFGEPVLWAASSIRIFKQ